MTKTFALCKTLVVLFLFNILGTVQTASAQMRQLYEDIDASNEVIDASFYSSSSGYVAFTKWIGFTSDSGRTFTQKYITMGNVNFNGYSVNLTFGFGISGVKAFDQNKIVVSGDYGFVPAILYSNNGGNSFTLVYHSQYNPLQLRTGITDMLFHGNTGFAVDADRILKSNDQGLTWNAIRIAPGSYFDRLEGSDASNVIAMSTSYEYNKLLKTVNGGSSWQTLTLPSVNQSKMIYAYFLDTNTGWLNMRDNDNNLYFYKTTNGGISWALVNNPAATPVYCERMRFTDVNTGYALSGFTVLKTLNGGANWEPLPRDNNYSYLGYGHNDLHFFSATQLWAGGGHGFLEMSTNAGGTPLPRAAFLIDSTGVFATGNVNLTNYSRTGYSYTWLLNGVPFSTSYNASYNHNIFRLRDTVSLVVSNGITTDTAVRYQDFYPPVIVTSFTPTLAGTGYTVTITGANFTGVTGVFFGNVAATSYTVVSPTSITAVVGSGASGSVRVTTATGMGSAPGFVFLPPPVITSFTPASAAYNTTVTITGSNFNNASVVRFGGIAALSYTVVSPTTITAAVPSGPSGSVLVTTPGGTASLAGYSSLPTITSFTPMQGTYGTVLQITGTSLSGTTSVTVGGTAAVSYYVNTPNSISAIVGAGASGNVVVTKASGSSSLPGFVWIAPPVINSFSPAAGPVGTSVTITGSGFNPIAANNVVMFGSVRATITSGNANSLIVTVPAGATFNNIKVTSNSLVAYSSYPFVVTFAAGGSVAANSFTATGNINTGADGPMSLETVDMDGDGKNDLLVSHYNSNNSALGGALIYRNTSTGGTISFAAPLRVQGYSYGIAVAGDLDGDGKPELLLQNEAQLAIFRNTSSPGNISFAAAVFNPENFTPKAIADFDYDGKADLLSYNGSGVVRIHRNISEPGAVAFAQGVIITSGGYPERNMRLADFDGDKKTDVFISGAGVLRNNSSKGNISFSGFVDTYTFIHSYVATGDMNGDGKTDIISGNHYGSTVAVMLNTSSGSNISFAAPAEFPASFNPEDIQVGDMDGDGKLDIVVAMLTQDFVILKNISSPINLAFATEIVFAPANYGGSHFLSIADLDNDGKADIITDSETNRRVNWYKNEVQPTPFIQSFTPTLGAEGTSVVITGSNFTGISSVAFGGIEAASFVVNSSTSITAIVGAGATGSVTVTNAIGTATLAGFVFGTPPAVTGISPLSGQVGSVVVITGINFSPVAEENKVSFGTVNATVIAATATTLSVKVPFGSMYQPIHVAVGGLSASSSQSFITSFANGGNPFDNNSFAPIVGLQNMGSDVADINEDGKPDLVGFSTTAQPGLISYSNTSTSGNISFGAGRLLPLSSLAPFFNIKDLNSDGKPDIVLLRTGYKMSFIRNTNTTPGISSFATQTDHPGILPDASCLDVKDLDGDGKPEVVVGSYSDRTLSVFRNVSEGDNISFEERSAHAIPGYVRAVFLEDIDGDGRPDMICASSSGNTFHVYRNTSTPGNISFAPIENFGSIDAIIKMLDADGDGKMDVVSKINGYISIHRNTSVVGTISFAAPVDLPAEQWITMEGLCVNDLDGDGKPEIFSGNATDNLLVVFKNNSTPGSVSFTRHNSSVIPSQTVVDAVDMDGDSRADIVLGGTGILRNINGGDNNPGILSFTPVSAVAGDTININGNNFSDAVSVSFEGTAAASFTIISDKVIKAVLGNGATGTVVVKNASGTGSLAGFVYGSQPVIAAITPASALPGTTVEITGANLQSATSVEFGGVPAASFTVNSGTSITAVTGSGASGLVTVSTPSETVSYPHFTLLIPPVIHSFTPTSAGGNSTVTISGENFTGATSVTLGGSAPSSFTVINAYYISVVTGNNASGAVQVTTPAGIATKEGFIVPGSLSVTGFFPETGTTGTAIIINGYNIGTATAVSFGGIPASSFTVLSPTAISAVVGAGASGNVSVTGPFGTVHKAGFSYVNSTTPAISYFSPATAGTGSIVTLTGMNFTGTTAVNFGGTNAQSFTIINATTIQAVVAAGTNSGNISVTNAGGTSSLAGFVFTTAPSISSFSPLWGDVGTVITIQGAGFSATPSSNMVYFGSVKGNVLSATSTTLSVRVPQGAIYRPLSVTTNSLTGYSNSSFLPIYSNAKTLSASSYAVRIDSLTGSASAGILLADFDSDSKADISVINRGSPAVKNNISFFRNNSAAGLLSLSARTYALSGPNPGTAQQAADIDGDGKLDIISDLPSDMYSAFIYRNTTTGSDISFEDGSLINFSFGGSTTAHGDFDADGKPDVAIITAYAGAIGVSRNTSTGSTISFAGSVAFGGISNASGIATDDIDGDGKTDIIVTGAKLYVFRNTSTIGNLSFVLHEENTSLFYGRIATGDIDADGKNDLVLARGNAGVAVVRNLSTPGYIRLDHAKLFSTGGYTTSLVQLADIDGDAKADIVVTHSNRNVVAILSNSSTPGVVSFHPKMEYAVNNPPSGLAIGDVDADGLPDILLSNGGSNSLTILKQQARSSQQQGGFIQLCANGNTVIQSAVSGSSFQWQQDTGSGFMNIGNNANFSGTNTAVLQLSNIPSAWYGYRYRCISNTGTGPNTLLQFVNTWTGAVNNLWNNPGNWSCGSVPDSNTDVIVAAGNVVVSVAGTCRSIRVMPGATVTVNAGVVLTVMH